MKLLRLTGTPDYGTNCYLYSPDDSGLWVIDPGSEGQAILSECDKLDIPVKGILLTHSHWDHVLGLSVIHEAWPDAPILIHELEKDGLGEKGIRMQKDLVAAFDPGFYNAYQRLFDALPEATGTFSEGDIVADGALTILHTPGHSPGSSGFYNPGEEILFSGDTLFRGSIGRSDLPGGDPEAIQKSLARLSELPAETRVLPGHGSPTTIGRERNENPWIE